MNGGAGPRGGRRPPSPQAVLARHGLSADRVLPWLVDAGLWHDEDGPARDVLDLLELASETADPEDAIRVLTTLAQEHPNQFATVRADDGWLRRVVAVAGTSRPLGDLLSRHADAVESLGDARPTEIDEVATKVERVLTSTADETERAAGIASIRRRSTADIASRDLTGVIGVEEVATELAALAEGVLTGATRALHAEVAESDPTSELAVIGMGKLGGRELNYISDVDVIFVHAPTDGDAGDDENGAARREATTVFERLLRLLNASTTMGRAYEIDPTLRPEGRHGPLSRTVESYVAYWERWAKTWEFQALLKARPVAGSRSLALRLLGRAEPFVYPPQLDPGVISEIREMKGRVEAKPEVVRHGERQIKLGPGGLRDIEFSVQLLQLVHGRADLNLRTTGTLPTLGALSAGGYIAEEDARVFASAYRELRQVEHRLQLAHERRTHTIPDDEERQEWLARSLGYRPTGTEPARAEFLDHLRRVQADVRDLHAKLFYRPLLELHAAVPAESAELTIPGAQRAMGEQAARERLSALGFRDPAGALREIADLTGGVSRRAKTMQAVLPGVLHVLSEMPDPDGGLRLVSRLVDQHADDTDLLSQLRDNPPVTDLLARVVGTSEVAGELLVSQPRGIDWLDDPDLRSEPRVRDDLVRAASGQLGWQHGLDQQMLGLRRFKRRELLRIVLRDVAGVATLPVTASELTALAEACLEAGLDAVVAAVLDEMSLDEAPARIALIGMGKLGGQELHYVSDLDVMFVHESAGDAPAETVTRFATRVAEQTIKTLGAVTAEGTAFEVDPDLRPEGRNGPLTRPITSYETYYARWSDPWEHQALLRARGVAGDPGLGARFLDLVRPLAFPEKLSTAAATQMRKLKARMERERVRRVDPHRHLKLGPGGLSDIEWTVQLLQQQYGAQHAVVRVAGTMAALDGLQDEGAITGRDATWLRDGYRFLSRVRNRLYLLGERNVDVLPSSDERLERLARALGYGRGGRQTFEEDRLRHARHVRQVTDRLFYETDGAPVTGRTS